MRYVIPCPLVSLTPLAALSLLPDWPTPSSLFCRILDPVGQGYIVTPVPPGYVVHSLLSCILLGCLFSFLRRSTSVVTSVKVDWSTSLSYCRLFFCWWVNSKLTFKSLISWGQLHQLGVTWRSKFNLKIWSGLSILLVETSHKSYTWSKVWI